MVPAKRRRDPNKPVMFMRSEEVTAIRNETADPVVADPIVADAIVADPIVADAALIQEPQTVLKLHSGGKEKSSRRSRPAPMIIKPSKSPFLSKQPDEKTDESNQPKARVSIDALKQALKKNVIKIAAKNKDVVVMPDAKTMQERARFRENQRISDDAQSKSVSRSKRAA